MTPDIREVAPRRVAYLREYGRYPQTLPKLWARFNQIAGSLGLFNLGGQPLSVMHDDMGTVTAEQLRGDAAIEVPADWRAQGGLHVEIVPGGLFAIVEHRGPYDRLGETWGELMGKWIAGSGYRVRAEPSYEVYLNDPRATAPPDLRTAIYLPITKP